MSRVTADNWIDANKAAIQAAQNSAFTSVGRFHQALVSHTLIPMNNTIPDNLAAKTTDTLEGWSNFTGYVLDPTTAIPLRVRMSVYKTRNPDGFGWSLVSECREGVNEYVKVLSFGPETSFREWDWLPAGTILGRSFPAY